MLSVPSRLTNKSIVTNFHVDLNYLLPIFSNRKLILVSHLGSSWRSTMKRLKKSLSLSDSVRYACLAERLRLQSWIAPLWPKFVLAAVNQSNFYSLPFHLGSAIPVSFRFVSYSLASYSGDRISDCFVKVPKILVSQPPRIS